MRTNIDIDETLLAEVMAAAETGTKKATVEEALRQLVIQHDRRSAVGDMTGLGWEAISMNTSGTDSTNPNDRRR